MSAPTLQRLMLATLLLCAMGLVSVHATHPAGSCPVEDCINICRASQPITIPYRTPSPSFTFAPTRFPTFDSTLFPSRPQGTLFPSMFPTTLFPTTASPTLFPSMRPTSTPTLFPTRHPKCATGFPSPTPTLRPSSPTPTLFPSMFPTVTPVFFTATPTDYPSGFPTPQLTRHPTQFPIPASTFVPTQGVARYIIRQGTPAVPARQISAMVPAYQEVVRQGTPFIPGRPAVVRVIPAIPQVTQPGRPYVPAQTRVIVDVPAQPATPPRVVQAFVPERTEIVTPATPDTPAVPPTYRTVPAVPARFTPAIPATAPTYGFTTLPPFTTVSPTSFPRSDVCNLQVCQPYCPYALGTGALPGTPTQPAEDANCPGWRAAGRCSIANDIARQLCRVSCNGVPITPTQPTQPLCSAVSPTVNGQACFNDRYRCTDCCTTGRNALNLDCWLGGFSRQACCGGVSRRRAHHSDQTAQGMQLTQSGKLLDSRGRPIDVAPRQSSMPLGAMLGYAAGLFGMVALVVAAVAYRSREAPIRDSAEEPLEPNAVCDSDTEMEAMA